MEDPEDFRHGSRANEVRFRRINSFSTYVDATGYKLTLFFRM
jgi:hypothetical protein